MPGKTEEDLKLIDEAMNGIMQAMARPRAWEQIMERSGLPIDRAGAMLLHILEQCSAGGCRLSDIAHRLGIEAPSVTRKVQQLEGEGFVQKVPDPKDGRASRLQITKEGHEIVMRLRKAKHELILEALDSWPPGERHTFATLFYRLAESLHTITQDKPKQPISKIIERNSDIE